MAQPSPSSADPAPGPRFRGGRVPLAVAFVALAALVVLLVVNVFAGGGERSRFTEAWGRYSEARGKLLRDQSALAEIETLEAVLPKLRDNPAEGYARWFAAIARYREAFTPDKLSSEERTSHLEKALAHLTTLADARFDERLFAKRRWLSPADETPVDALTARLRDDVAWSKEHAYLEPKPASDVVAVIRSAQGDIHLQFFPDLAPKHVENFVALARKGTYNGTAFHYVTGGTANPRGLVGGDPYTFFYNDPKKREHILRWGSGGIGYGLPPEEARFKVRHRRGIVTSQRPERADWDNAAQFQIVVATNPTLDHVHTPFAVVVEGLNLVERIAKSAVTVSQSQNYKDDSAFRSIQTRDLVFEPVWIHKVIVYRGGVAMEHGFPLAEGEKTIAGLSSTPAAPLPETDGANYCGRRLLDPLKAEEIRRGLDIPFPLDVDLEKSSERGERVALASTTPPPSAGSPPAPPAGGAK